MNRLFDYFKNRKGSFLTILMLPVSISTKAESLTQADPTVDFLSLFIIALLGFILLVLLYLLYVLKVFIAKTQPQNATAAWYAGLIKKLTDTVPVDQEEVILTDHIYDGIRELDNNLPPWWKYMFYATIVFAGAYMYYYHFSPDGQLQIEEYHQEVAIAEKEIAAYMKLAANSIDETNVKLSEAKGIENGKSIFLQNCAACHGRAGEGGVGPNLTDEYWLHEGGLKDVFRTIKYGVPQKGMISWKTQLSPSGIQDVASYIMSIQGTNPPNGKAPQGEQYKGKKDMAAK
jgi:cytochrome c oxidase cbb3-type subunit 3